MRTRRLSWAMACVRSTGRVSRCRRARLRKVLEVRSLTGRGDRADSARSAPGVRRGIAERVTIALFHSMFGLRPVERAAAARLRGCGYRVLVPDLFAGATVGGGEPPAWEEGFALMERVGWETIVSRAEAAVRDLPPATVLFGVSMGAGVVGSLWPSRLDAAGVILLHAPASVPRGVPRDTPVQLHVADDDPFAPREQLTAFRDSAASAGVDAKLYTYAGVEHFFIDPHLPDYDSRAAELAWRRSLALLDGLARRRDET